MSRGCAVAYLYLHFAEAMLMGWTLGSSRSADDDVAAYPQTWLHPLVAAESVREVAEHCRRCNFVVGTARCVGLPMQHLLHEALAEGTSIGWS